MKHLLLILTLLLTSKDAYTQQPFMKQVWLAEPDVAVNINDIAYQPNGYIWLATDEGVLRYNGKTFTKILVKEKQVATAVCASKNAVFVGFKNGLVGKVDGEKCFMLSMNKRLKSSITSLRSIGENILLIATEEEGLNVWMNGFVKTIRTEDGLTDNFVSNIALADSNILLATDGGINIVSLAKKQIHTKAFTTEDGLADNIVTTIEADKKYYWIGTQQSGVAVYDNLFQKITQLKTATQWTYGQVNDILSVGDNQAWAVTEEGFLISLIRVDDSLIIKPYSVQSKLKKIIRDKAGNIWCATNKGLLMQTALYVENIQLPSQFLLSNYTAMICDDENNLWFTQGKELYKKNLSSSAFPEYITSLPVAITALHATKQHGIWIGTFGNGLFNYINGKLSKIDYDERVTTAHILSITSTETSLWLASFDGVTELEINGDVLKKRNNYNKKNGVGSDYVYQLYADKTNRIWMATDGGGVTMYNAGKFYRWDSTQGMQSKVFYSLAVDGKGILWASSLEKGLYKYDGNRWSRLDERQGLQDINITAIAPVGNTGIVVVNRNGIDAWSAKDNQFRHFNRRLGMNIDSNSKVLNCIASDIQGNVYVPYEEGIMLFKENKLSNIKPDIHIKKLSLFFKDVKEERHHFESDENHISFSYDGINFSNPERLHYRYKLVGYDDSWAYTSNEVVPFAQLNPGNYTFRVQASLSSSFINATEDSYSFRIAKPFWQTAWFIVISAVIILSLLYAIVKWRERGIVKMNQLQRERLIYEYEHLKSQVNPHFLFNSFNTLVNIIEEDKNAAIDYTVHLSDLYRNMLSYKDADLVTLQEEYNIVNSYMFIQKSRFGEALQLHENISQKLLTTKKIVPLALQILLENAIKHNVVAASKPLHIYIAVDEDELVVRNSLQEKITQEKGTGIGIENIKKRYELLTKRTISYGIENNEYIVKLPLL